MSLKALLTILFCISSFGNDAAADGDDGTFVLGEADDKMLSELSIICRYVVEIHPATLMAVLYAGRNYVDDKYKAIWANRISTEIRVTCDQDLMDCYKLSRTTAIQACTETQKQRLEVLYNMVRKDLNLFQQG